MFADAVAIVYRFRGDAAVKVGWSADVNMFTSGFIKSAPICGAADLRLLLNESADRDAIHTYLIPSKLDA